MVKAMSEEQLLSLLEQLKEDSSLRQKLEAANDLDAALAVISEAGYKVTKEALANYQMVNALSLNDQDLEQLSGAGGSLGEEHCPGPFPDNCNSTFPFVDTGDTRVCSSRDT